MDETSGRSEDQLDGRRESAPERADRNWNELLQEFRVLQTGVQLLSGFLLTLPFQSSFDDITDFQRHLYLVLVVLAALSTCVMLAPIAVHRRVFRLQRKQQLVTVGHWLSRGVLVLIAGLVIGTVIFIFDIVVGSVAALVVGLVMLLVVAAALIVLPLATGRIRRQRSASGSSTT